MKKQILFFAAAIALASCGGSSQNSNQSAQSDAKADTIKKESVKAEVPAQQKSVLPMYTLSNDIGTKFLKASNDKGFHDSLKLYSQAIYNGKVYSVKYSGIQEGNEEANNGRDTPNNFDNIKGWIYEMQDGKRLLENPTGEYDAIWSAVLLTDDNFAKTNKILTLKNMKEDRITTEEVASDVKEAFAKRYSRKINSIFASAVFGDNSEYQLVNVQFENKGNQALGVSALVANGEIKAVKDYPAEWNESSVWRVDDEGEFGGLWLDFATEKDGALNLFTSNSGAEGCYYQNYVIDGDTLRAGNISAGFYQAPE